MIKCHRFEWSAVYSMLNTALFALYTDLSELGEKSYADGVLSENGLNIARS